jgi:hypothetical protein
LFFPGWIAAIVGGSVLMLLLLVIFSMPFGDYQPANVGAWNLPSNPTTTKNFAYIGRTIDLFPSGTAVTDTSLRGLSCRIHIHKNARWISIRSLFRRLHADGHYLVYIAVQNRDGSMATLRFNIKGPWPELDVNASAQDFVNAIQ